MSRTAKPAQRQSIRCAIYTRKSSEEGLDQEFNSLDAQREAAEAYIASQGRKKGSGVFGASVAGPCGCRAGYGWAAPPLVYDYDLFAATNLEPGTLSKDAIP